MQFYSCQASAQRKMFLRLRYLFLPFFLFNVTCSFFFNFMPFYVPVDMNRFEHLWQDFKLKYGKIYLDQKEEDSRKLVFSKNFDLISRHNRDADLGLKSFRLSVNRFTDLTSAEMAHSAVETTVSRKPEPVVEVFSVDVGRDKKIGPSRDWRKFGAVNKPIDQQDCGACWALAATSAIEAQVKVKFGKLYELSAQQLLDCSTNNGGCEGGLMTIAFADLMGGDGLVEMKKYPYLGRQGKCKANFSEMSPKYGRLKGYGLVQSKNETALKYAVHQVGPVTVGIDSKSPYFRFYWKGIYDDVFCSQNLNHAVVIVGYGNNKLEGDFWIIKNSWGEDWGERGFARIRLGKNLCGISVIPSYPILY